MLGKSYRLIFRQLSHGFCKDQKGTGQVISLPQGEEIKRTKKQKQSKGKKKAKSNKPPEEAQNKIEHKAIQGINWAQIKIKQTSPNYKHHQIFLNPQKFNNLYKNGNFHQQLQKLIDNFEDSVSAQTLEQYMAHYILTQPHAAYDFYIKNILLINTISNNSVKTTDKITYILLNSLIENSDINKIIQLLDYLMLEKSKKKHQFLSDNKEAVIETFELLSQLSCNNQTLSKKYKILSTYYDLMFNILSSEDITNRLRNVVQKILTDIKHKTIDTLSPKQTIYLQRFFHQAIKNKSVSKKFIRQNAFYQIISACYFKHSHNNNQLYQRLFDILDNISATIYSTDDFLQDFYLKFYNQLRKSRLGTTDCKDEALPINQTFLKNYEKAFMGKKKQTVLACLAIAFDNNYIVIPEHFTSYQNQIFGQQFSFEILRQVKQEISIRKLIQMKNISDIKKIKNTQHFQNIQSIKSRKLDIKLSIIVGQYEKAFKLFEKQYFDKARIQKEKQKIKYVLSKHIKTPKMSANIGQTTKNYIISEYVENKLDDQFLRESWRKNQDLGSLLQSYCGIKTSSSELVEGEESPELSTHSNKQDVRFSYWQKHFLNKRAIELHKLQTLGDINQMSDSEQFSPIPYHFNLNTYRNSQQRDLYWERGTKETKRIDQLKLFTYRLQSLLVNIEQTGVQKAAEKIRHYEKNLCQQNIANLSEFGIIGYDINYYDIEQLKNRIQSFKHYKGIIRHEKALKNQYLTLSQMTRKEDSLIQFSDEYSEPKDIVARDIQQSSENAAQEIEQQPAVNQQFVEELPEDLVSKQQEIYVEQQPVDQQKIEVGHPLQTKIKDVLISKNGSYRLSKQLIDLLRVKDRQAFIDAEYYTKVQKHEPIVNQLIEWGLIYNQPMAIYLAQKLAVSLNQQIPHKLAIRVSDFFSYHREISQQRINDCKKCLEVVGPIKRQVIYDLNKHYHHVHYKPQFSSQYSHLQADMQEKLEDLLIANPNVGCEQQYQKRKKLRNIRSLMI